MTASDESSRFAARELPLSLCKVCNWGIFLFTILLHEINKLLDSNARRLLQTKAFRDLTQEAARHPTDSSQYRFFASKSAREIWNYKATTWFSKELREQVDFIVEVFTKRDTYRWSSPIAHLIPRTPDYEIWQDACLEGAGGFSLSLNFWWALEWDNRISQRTLRSLRKNDKRLISINLLEYAAIIIGLAAAISTWEDLPDDSRPNHPISLLWTDNTSAASWTKKVAGLKGPQGKSLARIFAHLLMFSDMGTNAEHIDGDSNKIADFLSRIRSTDDFSLFSHSSLCQTFPQLKHCHRFQPSHELLSLITSALCSESPSIPTTRIKLRQAKNDSNNTKSFAIPS